MPIHAWLHIAPDDFETNDLHMGVQRIFSAANTYELEMQMNYTLMQLGAEPNITTHLSSMTEGVVNARPLGEHPSGLMWRVIPCYSDGQNISGA